MSLNAPFKKAHHILKCQNGQHDQPLNASQWCMAIDPQEEREAIQQESLAEIGTH
jgi:hypothetical protein